MKKILLFVFCIVNMKLIESMDQTEKSNNDKNYLDACSLLQGTSENGLLDNNKIYSIAAILADIRAIIPHLESITNQCPISSKGLLIQGNEASFKDALFICNQFTNSISDHSDYEKIIYFENHIDLEWIKAIINNKTNCKAKLYQNNYVKSSSSIELNNAKNTDDNCILNFTFSWAKFYQPRSQNQIRSIKQHNVSYDSIHKKITLYETRKIKQSYHGT